MFFLQRCFRKGSQQNRKNWILPSAKKFSILPKRKTICLEENFRIFSKLIVIVPTFKNWNVSKVHCSFSNKNEVIFCLRKQQIQTKVFVDTSKLKSFRKVILVIVNFAISGSLVSEKRLTRVKKLVRTILEKVQL